ncbi:MAG: tetratricopeptide repeat protein [Candidatus Obscuribacterales bacterium]|nr:tetratricopeptide repeat protein [Candidatus Obscuribacterales bacterium]
MTDKSQHSLIPKCGNFFAKKHSLFVLLLSLTIPLSTLSVLAITPQDEAKLAVVEKNLFFKSYVDEPLLRRVERLEKRFFGEALSGDTDERVAKIFEAAGPKIDADGTVTPGQLQAQPEITPNKTTSSAAPITTGSTPSPAPPDNDMAWEKASMAVMGARDDEIRALLKDAIKLTKRKETDAAFEKLNQVIRLDPQNAEGHFSLGVIYETKGSLDDALVEYNKALDINPDRLDYKDAIVSIESKGAKKKEFDQKQSKIKDLAEEAAGAFKRKEFISALELYKRLESDFPKNASYKYNIGTIYLFMRNPVQALEYYEMARKINPHDEKYSTAVSKLKETLKEDESKRKETEALWDAKEKADKKRGKDQQANQNNKQKSGGKQAKGRPAPGFNAPLGGRPPVQQGYRPQNQLAYQQPNFNQQPSMPGQSYQQPQGMPMYNQQPNFQNQIQQQQQQQQQQGNQYQRGYPPQQSGYPQQQPPGGFQQSFNQQPGFNQPQGGYPNQQQLPPGFSPQGQLSQPGFNPPPNQGQQMQQPNQGGVLASLGFLAQHSPQGLTVTTVGIGSRAAKAGLNKGDVIVAVDGVNITNMAQLQSILSRKVQGESTQVIINRNGNVGQVLL